MFHFVTLIVLKKSLCLYEFFLYEFHWRSTRVVALKILILINWTHKLNCKLYFTNFHELINFHEFSRFSWICASFVDFSRIFKILMNFHDFHKKKFSKETMESCIYSKKLSEQLTGGIKILGQCYSPLRTISICNNAPTIRTLGRLVTSLGMVS